MKIAFLNTTTTGRDSSIHELWEVALILRKDEHAPRDNDEERIYQFWPTSLGNAETTALKMSRFYERIETNPRLGPGGVRSVGVSADDTEGGWVPIYKQEGALEIASALDDATIVGSDPAFDATHHMGFLDRWLRRNGTVGTWRYRTIDIWPLAYGYWLGGINASEPIEARQMPRPFLGMPSDMLYQEACGATVEADQHTALTGARLARDVWDRITR